MPKPYTCPTLYDEVNTLDISFLRKHGYLAADNLQSGTVTWRRNGVQTARIRIMVNTQAHQPYIELDYRHGDTERNYRVDIVYIPSNLGKGTIPYFLCPATLKRCRKLYLVGGFFYHREAFSGCMYETQTFSHRNRDILRILTPYFMEDSNYSELNRKYFKRTYKGKQTKRYRKLAAALKQAEQLESFYVEQLLVMK